MSAVLASQRQSRILALLDDSGAVRVSDLVDELGVSDMTVRRDIELLAREGRVERVHGGAISVGRASAHEPGFLAKSSLMTRQKRAIAEHAATLVEPGSAVAISAGTTTPGGRRRRATSSAGCRSSGRCRRGRRWCWRPAGR